MKLAITKNFVGSPHIDRLDRSYQYAISFGNFEGGELCIESEKCGNEIFVINTKQRLVKLVISTCYLQVIRFTLSRMEDMYIGFADFGVTVFQ